MKKQSIIRNVVIAVATALIIVVVTGIFKWASDGRFVRALGGVAEKDLQEVSKDLIKQLNEKFDQLKLNANILYGEGYVMFCHADCEPPASGVDANIVKTWKDKKAFLKWCPHKAEEQAKRKPYEIICSWHEVTANNFHEEPTITTEPKDKYILAKASLKEQADGYTVVKISYLLAIEEIK